MLLRVNPRSITPPRNDREARNPLTIQRLSALVLKVGLLQPLRVFRNEEGALEMLGGGTRRLAVIEAGFLEVDALLCKGNAPSVTEILLERWNETALFEMETPSDQVAIALGLLKDNPAWTYGDLSVALGRSQASLTRLLRPFTLLPEEVLTAIDKGMIRSSYAYYLSQIAHLPEELKRIVAMIVTGKIRKREVLVKHVGVILNRTPPREGMTHEFDCFKVICRGSGDPTTVFRIADAAKLAAARMKVDGQTSLEQFWQLVNQFFLGGGGGPCTITR